MSTTRTSVALLTGWLLLAGAAIPPAARAQGGREPSSLSDGEPLPAVEQPQTDAGPAAPSAPAAATPPPSALSRQNALVASLTIFVLAIFIGFEVITKVPPTLHTPLMSGSNAISGITIVGALIAAGAGWKFSSLVGMAAVILATINAVGGFLVTHRMLLMFQKKKK